MPSGYSNALYEMDEMNPFGLKKYKERVNYAKNTTTPKSYYFDNQNAYNKYRIYITANNGNVSYTNIAEIEFYQALTGPMILKNLATYDETEIGGNLLTTKVELTAAGDTCKSINLDLWVKP